MLREQTTGAENMRYLRDLTPSELKGLRELTEQGKQKGGFASFISVDPHTGDVVNHLDGGKVIAKNVLRAKSMKDDKPYNPTAAGPKNVLETIRASTETGNPVVEAGTDTGNPIGDLEERVEQVEISSDVAAFEQSFDTVDNIALPYGNTLVVQFTKEAHNNGKKFLRAYGEEHGVVDEGRRIYRVKPNTHLPDAVFDGLLAATNFAVVVNNDVIPRYDAKTDILYFDAKLSRLDRVKRAAAGGMRISAKDLVVRYKNGNTSQLIAEAQAYDLVPRAFDLRIGVGVFGNKASVMEGSRVLQTDENKRVIDTDKLGRSSLRYQDWSERQAPIMRYN